MNKNNKKNNNHDVIFSSFSSSQEDVLHIDIKKGLNIQHQSINQNIQKTISPGIISKIHEYVLTHDFFDSGTEGVVYKVPVEIDGGISYFLVAKKRYDHDIVQEYENHKYLSSVLDAPHDFKRYVGVPKLYGKFDDATQNESYIIMDYIQGKTFFATLVEKISGIVIEHDKQAEKILNDMFLQKRGYATFHFADLVDFLNNYIQNNAVKLFSFQEGMMIRHAFKQFIKHIHQQGFCHRDIGNNLRNLIMGDDKKIYVIDFGCSIIVDKNIDALSSDEKKEIYYSGHKNNVAHYYAYDESFLDTIDLLTHKPPKREPRELF